MAAPKNPLIIRSDEHNSKLLGCASHKLVQTPNLDALAARGSPPPIATRRSASRRAPPSRPAATSTRPDSGTMPIPMTTRELASQAARGRPSRRVDRQAPFPLDRRRQRLQRRDRPDGRDRRQARSDTAGAREPGASRRLAQDGRPGRPRRIGRRARGARPRRRYPRALHQRPRRQCRRPRPLGQIEHVRGGRRRAHGSWRPATSRPAR